MFKKLYYNEINAMVFTGEEVGRNKYSNKQIR